MKEIEYIPSDEPSGWREEMICELCNEPIHGDKADVYPLNAHYQCLLRETLGGIGHLIAHKYWCLQKHDPDAGLTYRQSALLTDAFVNVAGIKESVERDWK